MKFGFISLPLFISSVTAFGWGSVGHEIIASEATKLIHATSMKNCSLSKDDLTLHVNDPDKVWKNQRIKHPHESRAHYFHVDEQPADWKKMKAAANMDTGFLPYKVIDFINEAKALRAKGDQSALKERLYGIVHYLGDLTQPLHLTSDHDGQKSGLSGLHSQYETKMVSRYEKQLRTAVSAQLKVHPTNPVWANIKQEDLIFTIAEQTFHKVPDLIAGSKSALIYQKYRKKNQARQQKPRFMKERLWSANSLLTINQLALAARLSAQVVQSICK